MGEGFEAVGVELGFGVGLGVGVLQAARLKASIPAASKAAATCFSLTSSPFFEYYLREYLIKSGLGPRL